MRKKRPFTLLILLLGTVTFCSFTGSFSEVPRSTGNEDSTIFPLLSKATGFRGATVVHANGLVSLASGLDNDHYVLDAVGRNVYFYVEARTGRIQNETARRLPLNLSIVIDRSGSMAGEKMDSAKKAAKGLIDKLLPTDFVSVVIYDEYIDVLQPPVPVIHKDSIKAKIGKIKPRGSTNLWGGSEKGYEQVKANNKPNSINRVLLISDGRANAGTIHPHRIREKVQEYKDVDGISISTFGVGLDYNETLMTDMAETGAGNYYYIDKTEKMEAVFEKELNSLLNTVAQNAELHIAIPKGLVLKNIYPFKYGLRNNEAVVKFRDLFSDETKAAVLQFAIPDQWNKEIAFTTELTFTDAADNRQKKVVNANNLLPVKSPEPYLMHFNKGVVKEAILSRANEKLEQAVLETDKGKFEVARKMLEENISFLRNKDFSAVSSPDLTRMDSTSSKYLLRLRTAREMNADTLKSVQKSIRAESYSIRNKKDNR